MQESLINDLMDDAKMENNQFKLENEFFSLPHLIYEVLAMQHPMALLADIQLRAFVTHKSHLNLLVSLLGDRRRYSQMLNNFLSNSMKFTKKGGQVSIRVEVESIADNSAISLRYMP